VKLHRKVALVAIVAAAGLWLQARGRDATHAISNHTEDAPPANLDEAAPDDYLAGQVVVDFRDDEPHARIAELGKKLGVIFTPASDYVDTDEIYTTESGNPAALIAQLRTDPDVEAADFETIYRLPEDSFAAEDEAIEAPADNIGPDHKDFPNDPKYGLQWHLKQIHAKETWKAAQGDGVIVAVVDTGVAKVPDLNETEIVPGWNFVTDSPNAADDHGHGTHVAGTIAQSTHNGLGVAGVAFHAKIMPIKVLSARGSGSMAGIAQGIRWAADHGAQVINMSLGGPFPVATITSAVKYAREKGVTVVAAAGNDGHGRVSYPGASPGVIGVAATQFDETTTFYSNWGPQIDIAAPGGNVRVDQNGDGQPDGVLQHTIVPGNISKTDYLWFMGTSMASPHVAGVAALIVGAGVRKPDAVEQVLLDTARKPKTTTRTTGRIDNHYGAGLVDAGAALRKARGGRGTGELGIGAAIALLGLSLARRRGRSLEKVGLGFAAALIAGSSGLFMLPFLLPQAAAMGHPALSFITSGMPTAVAGALGPAAYGNPLLWSAAVPLALTALLYGVRRLRPALAGLGFGIAGALLFAAVAGTVDVRFVPDFLDRAWLVGQAALAAVLATGVLVRK
jgi:serine protease